MGPKHGSRPNSRSRQPHAAPPSNSDAGLLAEARRTKQAAERKVEGAAKLASLEQSARLFQNALSSPLSVPIQEEALFDLGEVFLQLSSSLQARGMIAAGSPFSEKITKAQALEIHCQSSIDAVKMSRQSFEMYERVCTLEGTGELKQEARVNSGNALCDWASLAAGIPEDKGGGLSFSAQLYNQADERYSGALLSAPEDVELLTNVGDCCVQRAELAITLLQQSATSNMSQEEWAPVKAIYERGLQAYAAACASADARIGDDIGGLLQNWGAGLSSLGERTPDLEEAKEAYRGALEKLRSAISFRLTDGSLPIALGESLCNQAERFMNVPDHEQQVLKLLEEAVNTGYGAALIIDSSNVDALLGLGDAHLAAGKLLARIGNLALGNAHWKQSTETFMRAVKFLAADSEEKYTVSFEEQCDALYNLACVAALAGLEAEAARALYQLMRVDAMAASDLTDDSDLEPLHDKQWFQLLLQSRTSVSSAKELALAQLKSMLSSLA